jgi:hypothetical protein
VFMMLTVANFHPGLAHLSEVEQVEKREVTSCP